MTLNLNLCESITKFERQQRLTFLKNFPQFHTKSFNPQNSSFVCPKCNTIVHIKKVLTATEGRCYSCDLTITCYRGDLYILYIGGNYISHQDRYVLSTNKLNISSSKEIDIDLDFSNWDEAMKQIEIAKFYS